MMKLNKLITLSLIIVLLLTFLAACSLPDVITGRPSESSGGSDSPNRPSAPTNPDSSTVDLPPEQVPLMREPAIPIVLMPEASGSLVEQNEKAIIDYSNTADGYVMIKWLTETSKQLRVQITGPSDITYTYLLFPDNTFCVFPLSDGNGSYTVRVFEQTEGDKYALAISLTTTVSLIDEFAPFLRPNQYVNFTEDSAVVQKAASLVSSEDSLLEKIEAIYDFVVNNFTYDVQFAEEVIAGGHKGYIPVLDDVLARQKGICLDYAAVMTGMLRSQGIPTKLVEGYAGEVLHSWINVFSEETGWIDQVIFFDGETWMMMDPTFASSANNSASLQAFIGDGSNYSVLFLR